MTQKEFEDRIGRKVTEEDFIAANAAYMAAGDDIDKDKFCELYKNSRGLYTLVDILTSRITGLRSQNDALKEKSIDFGHSMIRLTEEMSKEGFSEDSTYRIARQMLGDKEYLKYKLTYGFPITDEDRMLIADYL